MSSSRGCACGIDNAGCHKSSDSGGCSGNDSPAFANGRAGDFRASKGQTRAGVVRDASSNVNVKASNGIGTHIYTYAAKCIESGCRP